MQVSGTELEVCKDIEARQRLGINKYGRTVREQDYQLVEWLEHAYFEALDQAIYLKRSIEAIKATASVSLEGARPKAESDAAACSPAVEHKSLPRSPDREILAEVVTSTKNDLNELFTYCIPILQLDRFNEIERRVIQRIENLGLGDVHSSPAKVPAKKKARRTTTKKAKK